MEHNYLEHLTRVRCSLDHRYYDEFLKSNAHRLVNPYHNLSHALRVAFYVHIAADSQGMDSKDIHSLVVAALYHDWGHPGVKGDDHENVMRAAAKARSLPNWDPLVDNDLVAEIIMGTEFPLPDGVALTEMQMLLRDADFWSNALLPEQAWFIAQVGLARERGDMSLHDWFDWNQAMISNFPTYTNWGRVAAHTFRAELCERSRKWAKFFEPGENERA